MNLSNYQVTQLTEIKTLVDNFVTNTKEGDGSEDSDLKQYIFEHAIQLFYGPEIWIQLRKWREPKKCPICQQNVTLHNSDEQT